MDTTALDAEVTVELDAPEYGGSSYVYDGTTGRRAEYTRFTVTNVVRVDRETWTGRRDHTAVRPWRVHHVELDNATGEVFVTFRRMVASGRHDHNGRGVGVWLWTSLADLAEQFPGVARGVLHALNRCRDADTDECVRCGGRRDAHTSRVAHGFVPRPGTLAAVELALGVTERAVAAADSIATGTAAAERSAPAERHAEPAQVVADWRLSGVTFDEMRRAVATRYAGQHVSRERRDAIVIAIHEAEFGGERRLVRIVHRQTGDVVRESDVTDWSDRRVAKLEDGMAINLDHVNYKITDSKFDA